MNCYCILFWLFGRLVKQLYLMLLLHSTSILHQVFIITDHNRSFCIRPLHLLYQTNFLSHWNRWCHWSISLLQVTVSSLLIVLWVDHTIRLYVVRPVWVDYKARHLFGWFFSLLLAGKCNSMSMLLTFCNPIFLSRLGTWNLMKLIIWWRRLIRLNMALIL